MSINPKVAALTTAALLSVMTAASAATCYDYAVGAYYDCGGVSTSAVVIDSGFTNGFYGNNGYNGYHNNNYHNGNYHNNNYHHNNNHNGNHGNGNWHSGGHGHGHGGHR